MDNNSNGYYDDGVDTPLDTAYNYLGPLRDKKYFPGAANTNMSSFMLNTRGEFLTMEPDSIQNMRDFMEGLDRIGFLIDPCTYMGGQVQGGVNCSLVNPKFMFNGDPISNYGWLQIYPQDIRLCVNTGPFTLIENIPVTIIVGYTLGQGSDRLTSVLLGKSKSEFVQQFYQSNFADNLVHVDDVSVSLPTNFELFQNYPNPFNPSTVISFSIPCIGAQCIVPVQLKVYDILGNEIATLVNEYKPAGSYEVEFPNAGMRHASSATKVLPSGIYIYKLQAGKFSAVKKMVLTK